ncbi:hypothetical protein ACHAW5_002610 [Stephanodiscus triporus]|uniref:Uncharacterized protein n=1 Tax=Stephanodiscus triporus TaxID=2934178 RepID=A0ABD3NNJ1_9STRA
MSPPDDRKTNKPSRINVAWSAVESDTCSETVRTETWTTNTDTHSSMSSSPGSAASSYELESGDGSPGSESGEWRGDIGGDGMVSPPMPPPPRPPPPPPSSPKRISVSSVLSRGSGGEESKDKTDRGSEAETTSLGVGPPTAENPAAAKVHPHPSSVAKDADHDDEGEEKSTKIKPPSIMGGTPHKSESFPRSDPSLLTSSSLSSFNFWGADGGGSPAASPFVEVTATQQLAQLVVSLRADLRAANAAREELEARLLEESKRQTARGASSSDEDSALLRLEGENAGLRADVDALFAEKDVLWGELAELREENKTLNDVIARLKREGDRRAHAAGSFGASHGSLGSPSSEQDPDELDSKSVADLETSLQSKRDLHEIIASLEERTVELEAEVNEANGAIFMLKDDLDCKDAQVKELLNNFTILQQKVSRAEQSNAALCHQNDALYSENDDLNTRIKVMTIQNKIDKEDIDMWPSMKSIEDDSKEHLYQEVKELLQQLEELRNKSSYKKVMFCACFVPLSTKTSLTPTLNLFAYTKVMAMEEEVYHLQENKRKMQQDLDESSDTIVALREALKDLEDTLAVSDIEIRKLKASLDEKEMSIKIIKSTQMEHQYESQLSADTIGALKMKVVSLETTRRDLKEKLDANSLAFLKLKDEKNDTAALITDLENKLTKATDENGALTKRISEFITANEKMKEEVKDLGESLATGPRQHALVVVAEAASSSLSSTSAFPSCVVSSDPVTSCNALISELRNKIKEIVSSRNAALEEVAILRSDASVAPSEAIEPLIVPATVIQSAEQNDGTSADTTSATSTKPSPQDPSPIRAPRRSIDSEEGDTSTNADGKTTFHSCSFSKSGSRGSSLLEAAKKLCSKLDEKKLPAAPKKEEPKAVAPSEAEQVNHILDQDDEEVSAKETKEDYPAEMNGKSGVKIRSPPEQEKKAKSKIKFDIDELTSIYFERCGMSVSKVSDVSWSSYSSRNKPSSDIVAKKVKICRNGVVMGTYEGDLNAEGQRHGFGVLLCYNGNSYEGEWKKDKRDGLGVAKYSSGDIYDGQWHHGKRHGHGIMYIEAGDTYIGSWNNGLKHGAGTYHWDDGEVDVSWYLEDKRVGDGVRWSANRLKAFKLTRGTKKEALSLDEAYTTAERLGFNLEKFDWIIEHRLNGVAPLLVAKTEEFTSTAGGCRYRLRNL